MPVLRFDDGSSIETGGKLRRLELDDGLYVTGKGFLIPVNTEEEVERTLTRLKKIVDARSDREL